MLDITRVADCGYSSCHCMYIQIEICSSFTSREMNAQSPLCSFDIFAMNNVFMTVIVKRIILLPRIRVEALPGLIRTPRRKPKCDRTATGRHLLPPVATGHLKTFECHLDIWMPTGQWQVFKLPTDRSPRWLVTGKVSINDAWWQVVGIRRMRAAACSSRTLGRINNIICDSCYDAHYLS
jgi:hypothetical protein